MGQIITMMDGLYEYPLPDMPTREEELLYYDIPKKHQYWGTPYDTQLTHMPKDVRRMPERERVEYIMWNRDKWLKGLWMFINGEPTYITGMHFDFLKFCRFEDFGRQADYLDQQRLDFYFRDLVRKDRRCYGKVILKTRRCGMTAEELCEADYTMLEDFGAKVAFQSNELQKKCLPELMHPFINMYMRRPGYMREEYQKINGKKPINSLKLTSNKADDEDSAFGDELGWLGGNAMAYPTVASAMDGSKKRYIIMDEIFKWINASAYETLNINKKCVVEYGIKGKIGCLSTMGDNDQVVEAVKEGCQLYAESDPRVRDANGRTTSGLYKWFVSAIHSADIPEEVRDIKYGKVNAERALEYVWAEINKHPKNSKNYIFELRRLPPEEKFALLSATDANYFNLIAFQSRQTELYALPKDKKPYVIGRFEESVATGKVSFIPDENGKWLVSLHPYVSIERGIDTRNRFRVSNEGICFPPINPEFAAAYDPIRYKTDDTTSRHLSQAAIVVFKKFDYFGAGDANSFAALYLDRPDKPEDAHYEALKACKYYGALFNPERQVESTEKEFDTRNCRPFIWHNPNDKIWGTWMQPKVAENGLQKVVTLFSPPATPLDKDHIAVFPWEVAIEDFKHFDLKNTTTSHITMAVILLAILLDNMIPVIVSDEAIQEMATALRQLIPNRELSGRMQ